MPESTEVAKVTGTEFAVLTGDTAELREAIAENIGGDQLSEFDIDRIKMPSGGQLAWEVPSLDGANYEKSIDGIIIAWFNRRAYWPGKFEGGNEPPQCSSLDGIIGEGTPGGPCAQCPLAQFGSSENEQSPDGQACKAVRLLFVLTPESMLPTVIALPPTSLKSVRSYMFKLSKASIPHTGVVTKLELEADKSKSGFEYSKVVLTAGARLSPEERMKVKEYADALMPSFARVTITQEDVETPAEF